MNKPWTYQELFRVSQIVEVKQKAGVERWLVGTVVKISTRLHVKHCACKTDIGCSHEVVAYDRSMYTQGHIRPKQNDIQPPSPTP